MSAILLPPHHPTLYAKGDDVKDIAPFLRVVKDAQQIVTDKAAAGLALPQIGVSVRIFVSKYPAFPICVNPNYESTGPARTSRLEGTLNKPGWHTYVPRFDDITAWWIDETGTQRETKLAGMEARVFQHLTDATNGISILPCPQHAA